MGPIRFRKLVFTSLLLVSFAVCTCSITWALALRPDSEGQAHEASAAPAITLQDAQGLLNLLPVVKELRVKGMELKWDVQSVSTMNTKDYYFFWIYNCTAQAQHDIGSISVGNYAVNKHTADMREWHVSDEVFHGNDGELVSTSDLDRLQEELRKKYGIDSNLVSAYRSAHLASKIIAREEAQSAVQLPVTERSRNTAELSCWKDSEHLISRLGRGPVTSSSADYRAYAEVRATAFKPKYQETYSGSLCENTVKLFVAKDPASKFQAVIDSSLSKNDCITIEAKDSCGIKGIRIVDWSKDGRFLLAELMTWVYESDALIVRAPVVYDVSRNEFIRPDVYRVFDEYYKTDAFKEKPDPNGTHCEFELHAEGFLPDGSITISASRPPDDPSYEQAFCSDHKQTFEFDLGSNRIKPLPGSYKAEHFGIQVSAAASKP
jgi:hypothetical protein